MLYGDNFRFTLFSKDPVLAEWADKAGVTYIGPDLEMLDKHKRQDAKKTWISDHCESDIPEIYAKVNPHKRFVRSNPVNRESKAEIDRLIKLGAETIMLPYFVTVEQAKSFVDMIGSRARPFLLLETASAAEQLDRLIEIKGVAEIHIGLNDLHLTLGMKNHFELLCSPLMEELCLLLRNSGIPFGFGGVGRAQDSSLPISSDLIYAQYPRLGAGGALISRVFIKNLQPSLMPQEVANARKRLNFWSQQDPSQLQLMREQLAELARKL